MTALIPYEGDAFRRMHEPSSRYLGASFVPALVLPATKRPAFMASPYERALAILGKRPMKDPDGMEVIRGKDLEPATICQLQRHGFEARPLNHYAQHPDCEWFIASPDFELDDGRLGEGKVPCDWEQWLSGPPLHVQVQNQWQLYCAGRASGMITALFVDQYSIEIKWWMTERNESVIGLLIDKARQFLDLIDRGQAWGPDESKSSYRALQDVIEVNETEQIQLGGLDHVERLLAWRQARKDRLAAEKAEDACKYWFASRAGTAGIIATDNGPIFRTKVEPKGKAPYFRWGGI